MTIGERIARIRKTNNLSQESFGEALGVTRQAISKWEADANIPDVEKLMAISRLYGVSVGYILGMEDLNGSGNNAGTEADQRNAQQEPHLSEEQLLMVEEIVKRYINAQEEKARAEKSQAEKAQAEKLRTVENSTSAKKPRRLRKIVAVVAVLALIVYFQSAIDELQNQNRNLQNSLYNMDNTLKNQSSHLAYQIEEILKSQNSLLAEYGCEIVEYDIAANTVTFSVFAEPKTHEEGMKVFFSAASDGEEVTAAGTPKGYRYEAQLTCPLSDNISVAARLVTEKWEMPSGFVDGQEGSPVKKETVETQIMKVWNGLFSNTMPEFHSRNGGALIFEKIGSTGLYWWEREMKVSYSPNDTPKFGDAEMESFVFALYINGREYGAWPMSPVVGEDGNGLVDDRIYHQVHVQENIPAAEGDIWVLTIRATDNYGREREEIDQCYVIRNGEFEYTDYPNSEELKRK